MDDETSRTSLASSTSRFTEDFYRNERTKLETQLQDAQSEVYQLRRIMPFLENTNPENPSQTFRTLASECADLREDRDRLRRQVDEIQSLKRDELQRKENMIEELRRELEQSREERDRYKSKCQAYEHELSNEESLYYRQQMSENRRSPSRILPSRLQSSNVEQTSKSNDSVFEQHHDRRVNFQIDQHAAKDSHLRNLYKQMDEENSEISSVASQSTVQHPRQEFNVNCETNFTLTDTPNPVGEAAQPVPANAATHLNDYITILRNYRANVRALYDQMKSTAQFFVDILKRLGYENDPQIQLMMRKINEINLNMQDSRNLSRKVLEDTRQIGAELAELWRSFERAGHSPNASKQDLHHVAHNSPELEAMLSQKDELIAELRNDKNELDNQCQKLQADFNMLQEFAAGLETRVTECKGREQEFIAELNNRKKVIASLAQQIQNDAHTKDAQLEQVKERMRVLLQSNMNTNQALEARIRDGAARSAYVLPQEFR